MDTPIELQISDIGNVPKTKIIRFIGDLDATNVEFALKKITELFESGFINLVADFKKLRYVNSTGLGILLHISRAAKEKEGCFKIANVNENVYEIIEIIGATSLLEIYENIDLALSSLQ
ncbi:STAS domain-containing protein [Fibrobacterota bacterium]